MAAKPEGNTFSIFSLLDTLRRRKLFVIIPTLLLGTGFWLYAYRQPDRYRAQALIAAEHLTPPEYLKHVAPQPVDIREHLWTVREVLYSTPVLEAAARQLPEYRDVKGPLPTEALEAMKAAIPIRVESEHTFTVSYEGADPQSVANVTNTLATLFVNQASVKTEKRFEDTDSAIKNELDALTARLAEQDNKVRSYKQAIPQELPEHVLENMRVLDILNTEYRERDSKISDEEARRTSIKQQMRDLEAKGALENTVIREKTPAEVQLETLRDQRAALLTRFKENTSDVIKVDNQIKATEQLVATQVAKIRTEPSPVYLAHSRLKAELEEIDSKVASYQREQYAAKEKISDYRKRVQAAPTHERKLDELTREMKVGESQLHALLDKKLDSSLAQGLENSGSGLAFAVVEPATAPKGPYSPQRERLILMGIVAGLGLGLVMAFFIEQNDTTFGTVDDFQAFTTMPVLGVIPTVPKTPKSKGGGGRNAIVTIADPESVPAEQYRILAMKIHQICVQSGTRSVMITSSAGGEGKSTTAINLATALTALADGPVLLVDADMRRPRLHEYLNTTVPDGRGFHSLLTKPDDNIQDYIVRLGDLSVIPGSAPTRNPIAALASPKVRGLFDRLKEDFKLIIVDAPPTLPIADSHILSGLCDKVMFVVRSRKTGRELFQHAVESFDAANLVGAVLNDVDYQRGRYAYAYEYYRENYLVRK